MSGGWPRVSVVIPTKNEARNIEWVLNRIPPGVSEVVIVDGRSVDGTVDVARSCRRDVRVIEQTRRGKGNALACGFAAASGEIIVTLDADGSMHPAEVVDFVEALLAGADYAKGTRFAAGGGSDDITRFRRAGNRMLNLLVKLLYGTTFTDLCYGYNAFWTRCLEQFELPDVTGTRAQPGDGFEIETLLNLRAALSPLVVIEVGSFESARMNGRSNLHAVRDGFRVLRLISLEHHRAAGSSLTVAARVVGSVVRPPTLIPDAAPAESTP